MLFEYSSDWYKRKRHFYYLTTHWQISKKGPKKRLFNDLNFLLWVLVRTIEVVRYCFCSLLLQLALKIAFLETPNIRILWALGTTIIPIDFAFCIFWGHLDIHLMGENIKTHNCSSSRRGHQQLLHLGLVYRKNKLAVCYWSLMIINKFLITLKYLPWNMVFFSKLFLDNIHSPWIYKSCESLPAMFC